MTDAEIDNVYAECASCHHYPRFHDGAGGVPCRAWTPNDAATDDVCPCTGWKAPVAAVVAAVPWGAERKDFQ